MGFNSALKGLMTIRRCKTLSLDTASYNYVSCNGRGLIWNVMLELASGTVSNHERLVSRQPVCSLRFEAWAPRIQSCQVDDDIWWAANEASPQTAHIMTADMTCCEPHNGSQTACVSCVNLRNASPNLLVLLWLGFSAVTTQCERWLSRSICLTIGLTAYTIGQHFSWAGLILQSPVVTIRTTRFNIHKFYFLPTQCIYVFCVGLRTNSDYFTIQH